MASATVDADCGRPLVPRSRLGEYTRMVDGRLVLVRCCGYCWAEYVETRAHRAYFCSVECSRRNAAWDRWVRDTNVLASHGDVNRPVRLGPVLPPAGKTLGQVERFRVAELPFEAVAS